MPQIAARFVRDRRAVSSLEFAIVAAPFFFLVLGILQLGVYYLTQSALDAGVLRTAETLRASVAYGTLIPTPTATTLQGYVSQLSGAMISSTVSVDLWQMGNLTSASQPINGHIDSMTSGVMVLRAQATTVNFAPIFLGNTLKVSSSAIFRGST